MGSEAGSATWTLEALSQRKALEFNDGYRTKRSELGDDGYEILRVAQVKDGTVAAPTDSEFVREEFLPKIGRKLAQPGDIILTTKGTVGRRARVPAAARNRVYSPQVCFFRILDEHFIDPDFFYYWLGSQEFLSQAAGLKAQTDMADYISLRDLRRVRVSLRPIGIQREIGRILRTIDDKVELNRRMNETLEATARAIFKSWFVDFDPVRAKMDGRQPAGMSAETADLFPDRLESSPIAPVPSRWEVRPLDDLVQAHTESVNPLHHPGEVFDHYSIPAFDAGGMPAAEHGSEIKSTKRLVPTGAILLSRLNPRFPRTWWVQKSLGRRTIASTEFLVASPRKTLDRSFVYCLFDSEGFRSRMMGLVAGTSGSHQRVNPKALLNLPIILPSHPIVRQFEQGVGPMLEQRALAQGESERLRVIREALLPRLMSGYFHHAAE